MFIGKIPATKVALYAHLQQNEGIPSYLPKKVEKIVNVPLNVSAVVGGRFYPPIELVRTEEPALKQFKGLETLENTFSFKPLKIFAVSEMKSSQSAIESYDSQAINSLPFQVIISKNVIHQKVLEVLEEWPSYHEPTSSYYYLMLDRMPRETNDRLHINYILGLFLTKKHLELSEERVSEETFKKRLRDSSHLFLILSNISYLFEFNTGILRLSREDYPDLSFWYPWREA